jgi:hypothetical protein
MPGKNKEEVELCVGEQTRQINCGVQELNVEADPAHLIVQIPPKLSISDYMGRLKGKSAIRVFSAFRDSRQRRYRGNHFWAQGYCVGTVGLDGREDTEVCKVAGKAGIKTGRVPIQQLDEQPETTQFGPPPLGAGPWPLREALPQSPALWAGIFTPLPTEGSIRRRKRLGGWLNYYYRQAA